MSPKDKAKELRGKFGDLAIDVVNEIIEAINNLQYERKTDYWQEVKQEIEKLLEDAK